MSSSITNFRILRLAKYRAKYISNLPDHLLFDFLKTDKQLHVVLSNEVGCVLSKSKCGLLGSKSKYSYVGHSDVKDYGFLRF